MSTRDEDEDEYAHYVMRGVGYPRSLSVPTVPLPHPPRALLTSHSLSTHWQDLGVDLSSRKTFVKQTVITVNTEKEPVEESDEESSSSESKEEEEEEEVKPKKKAGFNKVMQMTPRLAELLNAPDTGTTRPEVVKVRGSFGCLSDETSVVYMISDLANNVVK